MGEVVDFPDPLYYVTEENDEENGISIIGSGFGSNDLEIVREANGTVSFSSKGELFAALPPKAAEDMMIMYLALFKPDVLKEDG